MRIGIFIQSLFRGRGGAERSAINLARGMQELGHETLLVHDTHLGQAEHTYPIPEGLRCCNLFTGKRGRAVADATSVLQGAECDVFCVFSYNVNSMIFLYAVESLGIPLVWSERSAPWLEENVIWNREQRLRCLSSADMIHFFFPSYISSLPEELQGRVRTIPNFFDTRAYDVTPTPKRRDKKILLAVGSLNEPIKQHSFLISAFALLREEFPEWECHICGEGPFNDQYRELIDAFHLQSRVFLEGNVSDVRSWYESADLFCLPSRSEGFPMALLEAQAHGLPAVGFADCSGVNELIRHERNGLLASTLDPSVLARCLAPLMRDGAARERFGSAAREDAAAYNKEHVLGQWEELFHAACARKGRTTLDRLRASLPPEKYQQLFCKNDHSDAPSPILPEAYARVIAHRSRSCIRLDTLIQRARKAGGERGPCV